MFRACIDSSETVLFCEAVGNAHWAEEHTKTNRSGQCQRGGKNHPVGLYLCVETPFDPDGAVFSPISG
jgi:hypothetical protein